MDNKQNKNNEIMKKIDAQEELKQIRKLILEDNQAKEIAKKLKQYLDEN